jgi:tetratricopeptide (TPR) repeat protein
MKSVKKSHHTLGLAMIMKDEIEDLHRIIHDYSQYFDKIYVTVTHKKTYTALQKHFAKKLDEKVELSYFKWIDHFGKARRFNQQQIKTDYWMWIDLDDEIEGAEHITKVIDYMVTNNIDAAWFLYDYVQRSNFTEPETIQWRERIIKTDSGLQWREDPVHETIVIEGDKKQELISEIIIKHRQLVEHTLVSGERNRLILEKDWQLTHRAETAYYLGEYIGALGDYEGASEKLLFAVEHSESEMFRFAAWQNLFKCYYHTSQYDAALHAADKCLAIDADHPDPWFYKFMTLWAKGEYDLAMQSAEIAISKRGDGERAILRGHDPSFSQYVGPFNVAKAYLALGNVERAHDLYLLVNKIAPKYIEEQSPFEGTHWGEIFEKSNKDKPASN